MPSTVVWEIVDTVNRYISTRDWQSLDDELALLNVDQFSDLALVAWCRATHPVRSVLPSREAFIEDCYRMISDRHGADLATSMLKGLRD